ncbi:MAG: FtsQ-type POTRA domain-containing protein [Candidatus Limnocylindrales bacterium]
MTQRPSVRRTPAAHPTGRRPVATTPLRRTRRIRRASAGLSPIRAGAMLVLLLTAAATYGVANSSAFEFAQVRLEGASFTPAADVEAALDEVRGENLFRLDTGPLEDELRRLQTVREASVAVRLPDTLVVRLEERTAILLWRVGERRYLVDLDGNLFARLGDDQPTEAASLPVIEDKRAASAGLSVGRRLEAVDLDAATRLASLVPTDLGSEADGLDVWVSDANGFVIRSRPASWTAIFGFYTASLRTPELVPGQVRLLRSLLIGREPLIERVILASDTDGTFISKPTPTPRAKPSATPAP